MDRFTRLLTYLPDEHPMHAVIRTADSMAGRNQASVTLFDVIQAPPERRLWKLARGSVSIEDEIRALVEERLEQAARLFENVEPERVVGSGVDFIEVIQQVYRGGHDMVLVGSHPRSSVSSRLDPTLTHLLRKCPVPVWVVDESHRSGDVMVAIGAMYDQEARALNRKLLEMGSSLAERQDAKLHVVHAWRVIGESLMVGSRVSLSAEEAKQLIANTEEEARLTLKQAIEEVPAAAGAEVHLLRGAPDQKIIDIVEEVKPSVLVMGTVARKGIRGMIIGNTAERVLLTVDTSVIAVKPAWFASPVPPPADALGFD